MATRSRLLFITGMGVCLAAAALMLADVVNVGWGSAIGVVGIGVLSAAATGSDADADES